MTYTYYPIGLKMMQMPQKEKNRKYIDLAVKMDKGFKRAEKIPGVKQIELAAETAVPQFTLGRKLIRGTAQAERIRREANRMSKSYRQGKYIEAVEHGYDIAKIFY